MPIRIEPDHNQPSVAIEIPLEKPLPDYDLEQVEQPTPRDIDALLVSQGFRDLVDDARGVLTELVANPPPLRNTSHFQDLELTEVPHFEIAQLTGAICPGDELYRPGAVDRIEGHKAAAQETADRSGAGTCASDCGRVRKEAGIIRLGSVSV